MKYAVSTVVLGLSIFSLASSASAAEAAKDGMPHTSRTAASHGVKTKHTRAKATVQTVTPQPGPAVTAEDWIQGG